jgi:hypothetical protein
MVFSFSQRIELRGVGLNTDYEFAPRRYELNLLARAGSRLQRPCLRVLPRRPRILPRK